MKKLVLGLGLLAMASLPALAGGTAPSWTSPLGKVTSPNKVVLPNHDRWPGDGPVPLFHPFGPGVTVALPPGISATTVSPTENVKRPPPKSSAMTVRLIRDNADDCGERCATWLFAEGKIGKATPDLFRKALAAMGEQKPPVLISSPGGDVVASMAIGRMIHAKGLDVIVSRTEMPACPGGGEACHSVSLTAQPGKPLSFGAYCNSACVNILAAGAHRVVPPQEYAAVGMHDASQTWHSRRVETSPTRDPFGRFTGYRTRVYNGETWQEPAGPGTYKTLGSYFKSMGITGDVVSLMHLAQPDDIYWLTGDDLGKSGLATDRLTSEEYISAIERPTAKPDIAASAPPVDVSGQATTATPAKPDLPPPPVQAPLAIHLVQTEIAHVPAGSLPMLEASADSSNIPFANATPNIFAAPPSSAPASVSPPIANSGKEAALSAPAPAKTTKRGPSEKKPPQACGTAIRTLPASGFRLTGEVRAVLPTTAANAILQRAEDTTHVQVNPKYFGYTRLGILVQNGGMLQRGTAVAPPAMNVQPGDTVTILTRHQDGALPCHFVPNLVVAVRHQ